LADVRARGGYDAERNWTLVATDNGPRIRFLTADKPDPMPGSASL
jgi:hypothetical protein